MNRLHPAENVGIRGMYVYFPRMMVQQEDLEAADGCTGKYTIGLGQQTMTFCGDREDVVSMAATAVLHVMANNGIMPADIGRVEVGTETGVDRSKSVMSYLVQYFNDAGNYSVQGADHMHGCYGGTSALFTVTDWVASPSWDGRLGLVVATDIAVYPPGSPARPTGGCGAAAMLIGPDAPLVVEPWPWRSSFSAHTYDFFKPHGHPLYPVVDGPATLHWFTKAADACAAQLYLQLQQHGLLAEQQCSSSSSSSPDQGPAQQQQQQQQRCSEPGLLSSYDYFLSHSPYNKIVRKVFARLVLADALRAQQPSALQQQQQQQDDPQQPHEPSQCVQQCLSRPGLSADIRCTARADSSSSRPSLPQLPPEAAGLDVSAPLPDSSIQDKGLERAMLRLSEPLYQTMASQGASLQQQLGNLYTASMYSGLASLLAAEGARLAGQRILCFSFGSGVVASMFTLTCRGPCSAHTISRDGANGHQRSGGVHADSSMSNNGRAGTCACHRNTGHQACGNLGAVATEQQQQQQPPCQQQPQQQPSWPSQPCSLGAMASQLSLQQRLSARQHCAVNDFDAAMSSLCSAYNSAPYTPAYGCTEDLQPDTVYLTGIDKCFRRSYSKTPSS